jgi:hypothetical protein
MLNLLGYQPISVLMSPSSHHPKSIVTCASPRTFTIRVRQRKIFDFKHQLSSSTMKWIVVFFLSLFTVLDAFVIQTSLPATTTTSLALHPSQGAELQACAYEFLQRESTLKAAPRRGSSHPRRYAAGVRVTAPDRRGATPLAWCRRMMTSPRRRRAPRENSPPSA